MGDPLGGTPRLSSHCVACDCKASAVGSHLIPASTQSEKELCWSRYTENQHFSLDVMIEPVG